MNLTQSSMVIFLVGAILGSAGALGATGAVFNDNMAAYNASLQQENGGVFFATRGVLHGNVYTWGYNKRKNITPEARILELDDDQWVTRSFTSGKASIANVWWWQLDEVVSQNPDVKVLPYEVNTPETLMGVYVRENSSINNPEDLHGKQVSYPDFFQNYGETTRILLKEKYNVTIDTNTTRHHGPANEYAPIKVMKNNPEVDAVVMTGTERLGENHSLRPVFLPFKEMNEKFGDSALMSFFVVKNDPEAIDAGYDLMKTLQVSSDTARAQKDQFMAMYNICNEFMVPEDREQIERMSSESVKQMQYFLDAAYEQDRLDRRVNISEYLLQRPS